MARKRKEPAARKKKESTPGLPDLDAHRHQDTRKNIPTEFLRVFMAVRVDVAAEPSGNRKTADLSADDAN